MLLVSGLLVACSAGSMQESRPWWEEAGSTRVATPSFGEAPTSPVEAETMPIQVSGSAPALRTALYPGSGDFIRAPSPTAEVSEVAGDITLNFESADVREVVDTVLGELLGLNYLIAPDVAGDVTLQTSRPVSSGALLRILEDALTSSGLALVSRERGYHVVTASSAPAVSRGAMQRGGVGYGTRVVPLRFVSAAEMADLLEPFSSEQGLVRVDSGRNLLIMSGNARELDQLQEMVESFDVDWLTGMSVGMVALQYARADAVVEELGAMWGEQSPLGDMIRLIPLERLNAVLVVTPQPRYLSDMRDWLQRLDQPMGGEGRRLHVYRVENGSATNLAGILRDLFAEQSERQVRQVEETVDSGVAPSLRPSRVFSPPIAVDEVESGIALSDDARKADETIAASERSAAGSRMGDIGVIADEANNALVILASPNDYRIVESALRQLDVRPLQVLVEATIVDVTLSDELSYGVQWFLRDRINGGRAELQVGQSLAFGGSFAFSLSNAAGEVRALLRALAEEGKVEVLSSPSLMVLDNQTASIQVGNQQPVTTAIITDGGVIAESVQFRDTGVILDVTPRANSGGLINLDIRQEVTDVGETDAATGQRAFLQRNITSKVAVQSGDTIVLGGLIRENRGQTRSGVPGLHRLPLVGGLFGQRVNTTSRSELLVLITPRAIRSRQDAVGVTEEFRNKLGRLRHWQPDVGPRVDVPPSDSL